LSTATCTSSAATRRTSAPDRHQTVEPLADVVDRRAHAEVADAHAAVDLVERPIARHDDLDDVVHAHPAAIAVVAEQIVEAVHRRERQHVLLVQHHATDPDRRHRQSGGAVAREGAREGGALVRELLDGRREGDGRVVGRQIVAPQAVDDEHEHVRPAHVLPHVQIRKMHGHGSDLNRAADIRVRLEEIEEPDAVRRVAAAGSRADLDLRHRPLQPVAQGAERGIAHRPRVTRAHRGVYRDRTERQASGRHEVHREHGRADAEGRRTRQIDAGRRPLRGGGEHEHPHHHGAHLRDHEVPVHRSAGGAERHGHRHDDDRPARTRQRLVRLRPPRQDAAEREHQPVALARMPEAHTTRGEHEANRGTEGHDHRERQAIALRHRRQDHDRRGNADQAATIRQR
jgi:hypothetical protein